MFFKHRSILFPVILIGLTVVLILVVVFVTKPGPVHLSEQELSAVDAEEYQTNLTNLMSQHRIDYDAAYNDMARLVVTEEALRKLLDLRVPAIYKELHLELAIGLNLIQNGLRGEGTLSQGLEKLIKWVNNTHGFINKYGSS